MEGADAVVGVIGSLDAPEALLLGRPDEHGRLRVAGRTVPLTLPARREIGAVLRHRPDGPDAGQLAMNLIWHGERMLFLDLIDAPGMMSVDELVESATTVWMRAIYLADDPAPSTVAQA